MRKGDRLQVFVQAAIAVFVVNAMVVSVFSLLGARDVRGVLELWFASAASAAGSSIATVGTFAVLGSVFGILTVFQLLEMANPSQPLLRRLLVETPGTYHHSLMVGNLAERAAEAIGADPLVTRVAAYYHDVGKLSNPLAFIENQAGGENIHDQLAPEVSAQVLKQHVADGIDIAYAAKLPKALIAYIPQHHGTAIMSYFYARAKEQAAEPYGGLATVEGAKAAAAVDERRFRHIGPKPQTREAALIMLADGVEASVRSLSSRDEPAIRAMVTRIIEERIADGQFDECDLTLRDLERIRNAFVEQLLGMYHTRVAYPQNTIVELESRRAAAGGGGRGRARVLMGRRRRSGRRGVAGQEVGHDRWRRVRRSPSRRRSSRRRRARYRHRRRPVVPRLDRGRRTSRRSNQPGGMASHVPRANGSADQSCHPCARTSASGARARTACATASGSLPSSRPRPSNPTTSCASSPAGRTAPRAWSGAPQPIAR